MYYKWFDKVWVRNMNIIEHRYYAKYVLNFGLVSFLSVPLFFSANSNCESLGMVKVLRP